MMSSPDRAESQKVTIEALLRLKRSERPAPEFWNRFEQELRAKQLAAIVEKRPWWIALRLPRAMSLVARLQVPAGAAAVLVLSFVVIREYHPFSSSPGGVALAPVMQALEPHVSGASADVIASTISAHAGSPADPVGGVSPVRVPDAIVESVSGRSAGDLVDTDQPVAVGPGGLMAMIPWAAPEATPVSDAQLRPALGELPHVYFASSVFAGREHNFEGRVEVEPVILSAPVVTAKSEGTIVQATASPSSREVRRNRILSNLVIADNASEGERSRLGQVREVLTSALDDDRLYDSVRRLGMGGDRLTLKF